MNDLAQFFRALCRRWCQSSHGYEMHFDGKDYIGEMYRIGPWYIVIAKDEANA